VVVMVMVMAMVVVIVVAPQEGSPDRQSLFAQAEGCVCARARVCVRMRACAYVYARNSVCV